jgi:hypothetical protein
VVIPGPEVIEASHVLDMVAVHINRPGAAGRTAGTTAAATCCAGREAKEGVNDGSGYIKRFCVINCFLCSYRVLNLAVSLLAPSLLVCYVVLILHHVAIEFQKKFSTSSVLFGSEYFYLAGSGACHIIHVVGSIKPILNQENKRIAIDSLQSYCDMYSKRKKI